MVFLSLPWSILVYICLSWVICRYLGLFQAISGSLELSPGILGYIGLYRAISGYIWLFLARLSYLGYLYQVSSIRVQFEAAESKLLLFETVPCFFLYFTDMSCRGARAPKNVLRTPLLMCCMWHMLLKNCLT